MRPFFKPYVQFAKQENGVYFKTWTGEFVMNGASLYPWIEQLANNLDGTRTLDELTATMPEAHAGFAKKLVLELTKRGVIEELGADADEQLSDREESQYRQTLLFLAEHAPDPRRRFLDVARKKGFVAGEGLSYLTFVGTMQKMGLQHLQDWQSMCAENFDFVAYVSDEPDVEMITSLSQRCAEAQIPLFVATVLEGRGVICESGFAQLMSRLHRREELSPHAQAPIFKKMIGNMAALEAFKALSEIASHQEREEVLLLDPETLESTKHPLSVNNLIDEQVGILSNLQPGALWQIPMPHMGVTVHFPRNTGQAPQQLAAPGESLSDAQERVLRQAVLRYLHVTDADKDWAVGTTEAEWKVRGLVQQLWLRAEAKGTANTLPLNELSDAQSAMYVKMLGQRFELDVSLVELEGEVPGVYCHQVLHGNRVLAQSAGRTRDEAGREALLYALSRVQMERNNPSVVTEPALTVATTDWAAWLESIHESLHEKGIAAVTDHHGQIADIQIGTALLRTTTGEVLADEAGRIAVR